MRALLRRLLGIRSPSLIYAQAAERWLTEEIAPVLSVLSRMDPLTEAELRHLDEWLGRSRPPLSEDWPD